MKKGCENMGEYIPTDNELIKTKPGEPRPNRWIVSATIRGLGKASSAHATEDDAHEHIENLKINYGEYEVYDKDPAKPSKIISSKIVKIKMWPKFKK